MSQVPQSKDTVRPQGQSNTTSNANSQIGTDSDAQKASQETAARFSLDVQNALAEQAAKVFDEQADFIEQLGGISSKHAIDRIVDGITAALAPIIRANVAEQLPAVVAQQADRLREVARALRSSAG